LISEKNYGEGEINKSKPHHLRSIMEVSAKFGGGKDKSNRPRFVARWSNPTTPQPSVQGSDIEIYLFPLV